VRSASRSTSVKVAECSPATGITSLLGTVAHECSLTPSISSADASAAYARILRERQRKAAEPKRTLKRLEVDDATANRLASGMGAAGIKGRVATFNVSLAASPVSALYF
jgi:transcription initiation factor TFIIF subunit beta